MWLPDAAQVAQATTTKGRRFVVWTREYLREVVSETSAHGCNHLTKPGRHSSERVTWFLILAGAGTGALLLCLSTFDRYRTSPVVISLERNYIDWKFILPAVYICPDTYVSDQNLKETVKRLENEGYGDGNTELLTAFVEALANASSYSRLEALETFRGQKGLPTSGFLDIVTQAMLDFKGNDILHPTVTEVGICYAHNSIIANWTSPFPVYRAIMAASSTVEPALSTSSLKKPNEYTYEGINTGYWSYIHAANTLPSLVRPVAYSPFLSSTKVRMRTRETYATEAVRGLSAAQRGCRTEREVPKGVPRPEYTSAACREWCRAHLARSLCGCRPYFVNISGIPECDIDGMLCLSTHLDLLRFLRNQTTGQRLDCGCLPACNEYSFELLKLTIDYLAIESLLPRPAALGQQVIEMSRVRFKRDVLFSIVDLCVSFGGAVGLCLGCSVLTLVELIYYLSIRVLLALRGK